MKLPEELALEHLRKNLTRGKIFWFRATLLDNPAIREREKFAVVVSCAIENDEVMFLYTTSQHIEEYRASPLSDEVLFCAAGSYACFPRETAIPVRNIKTLTVRAFAALLPDRFQLLDSLSGSDLALIDRALRKTRQVEVQHKLRCLPGAIRKTS